MTTYVIGQIRITDPVKWTEYKSKVQFTLEPFGGRVLLRGKHIDSFVGTNEYPDIVVIEFDSCENATQWYNSDAYQSIIAIRDKGAKIILHLYQ